MGMSTHIVGFRPADAKWKAMKAIWDACKAAGVQPPLEVDAFFGGEKPDPMGVEVTLGGHSGVSKWQDKNAREGFEVDLRMLPKDVTILRFYNSW